MANILILTDRQPWPMEDGGALRVINLAKSLAKFHNCHLVTITNDDNYLADVFNTKAFSDIKLIKINDKNPSIIRHLRISDENYLKLAWQDQFERVVDQLNEYVDRNNIKLVLGISIYVSEYLDGIHDVKKVLDDYDCRTLSVERNYSVDRHIMSLIGKIKYAIDLCRIKKQESKISGKFDLVTTISPVDLARIKSLNGNADNIAVVANGVSNALLGVEYSSKEIQNSIAFWGNLVFPPNRTAIEFFCEKIYLPYLRKLDIKWYIIGKNPGPLLMERSKQDSNIVLTGFVDDLFEFVSHIPVMVNPMVTGSGQKNKVLEAFMLARGVVSTSMGMESFSAIHNKHCLIADTPEIFAQSIIELLSDNAKRAELGNTAKQLVLDNYTWDKVGCMLNASIDRLLSN